MGPRERSGKQVRFTMFQHVHRDTYTVILAVLVLAGLITWMLVSFNPVR